MKTCQLHVNHSCSASKSIPDNSILITRQSWSNAAMQEQEPFYMASMEVQVLPLKRTKRLAGVSYRFKSNRNRWTSRVRGSIKSCTWIAYWLSNGFVFDARHFCAEFIELGERGGNWSLWGENRFVRALFE